jgi:hypothetical protein
MSELEDDTVSVQCPYCGEWQSILLDPESVGEMVQDLRGLLRALADDRASKSRRKGQREPAAILRKAREFVRLRETPRFVSAAA